MTEIRGTLRENVALGPARLVSRGRACRAAVSAGRCRGSRGLSRGDAGRRAGAADGRGVEHADPRWRRARRRRPLRRTARPGRGRRHDGDRRCRCPRPARRPGGRARRPRRHRVPDRHPGHDRRGRADERRRFRRRDPRPAGLGRGAGPHGRAAPPEQCRARLRLPQLARCPRTGSWCVPRSRSSPAIRRRSRRGWRRSRQSARRRSR